MSYQVLARKYRPQRFSEVVGQQEVTRTLENSIRSGRVANAYIFCGPRGIGKTSVARIVAKKLNCTASSEKSPCGKCLACKEITQGADLDVLEIDGASNNSVDEIRALRENVKFTPSRGRYKIYIIDEVHMLSQGAFNALLKTLEEPPAHVKFMFATTEPHKVPATILSRCQRFDFRRISPPLIRDNLLRTAEKEKIGLNEEAALLIARAADGSLRDSLVMLEQMNDFSEGEITAADVVELLGMVSSARMFDLSEAIIGGDFARSVKLVDEFINAGREVRYITDSLIAHMRDVMVLKTGGKTSEMAFTDEEAARMERLLEKISLEEIIYIMQNLIACSGMIKDVFFSRAPLELTLIKLAKRGEMLSLPETMDRLEGLLSASSESVRDLSGPDIAVEGQSVPVEGEDTPEKRISGGSARTADFAVIEKQWNAIVNLVQKEKMSVGTFLEPARPVELNGKELVIGFPKAYSFNRDALDVAESKELISNVISRLAGNVTRLKLVVLEFLSGDTDPEDVSAPRKTSLTEMKPAIESVMDVFGGHIIRDYVEDNGP